MKRSLFALAALSALAGAAQAQSSVTVSGVIDESYKAVSQTTGTGLHSVSQGLKDSQWTSNRLILKGEEDMGGGLKSVFFIESGMALMSADAGQAGLGATTVNNTTAPWQNLRQTYVGLKDNKFGELRIGYQYAPEYFQRITNIGGSANVIGTAGTSASGVLQVIGNRTIDQYNAATWTSPAFYDTTLSLGLGTSNAMNDAGFTKAATANTPAADTGLTNTNLDQKSSGLAKTIALAWEQGPAKATLSNTQLTANVYTIGLYPVGTVAQTATAAANTTQANTTLSASYDFGMVKLVSFGAIRNTTDVITPANNLKTTVKSVGALVPVTPRITLGANYGMEDTTKVGVLSSKGRTYQASVQYAFSKRTSAYAIYARAFDSTISTSTGLNNVTQTGLGLMHTF
jgi:predicted porin